MEDIIGFIIVVGFIAYMKRDAIMAKFKEFTEKK